MCVCAHRQCVSEIHARGWLFKLQVFWPADVISRQGVFVTIWLPHLSLLSGTRIWKKKFQLLTLPFTSPIHIHITPPPPPQWMSTQPSVRFDTMWSFVCGKFYHCRNKPKASSSRIKTSSPLFVQHSDLVFSCLWTIVLHLSCSTICDSMLVKWVVYGPEFYPAMFSGQFQKKNRDFQKWKFSFFGTK